MVERTKSPFTEIKRYIGRLMRIGAIASLYFASSLPVNAQIISDINTNQGHEKPKAADVSKAGIIQIIGSGLEWPPYDDPLPERPVNTVNSTIALALGTTTQAMADDGRVFIITPAGEPDSNYVNVNGGNIFTYQPGVQGSLENQLNIVFNQVKARQDLGRLVISLLAHQNMLLREGMSQEKLVYLLSQLKQRLILIESQCYAGESLYPWKGEISGIMRSNSLATSRIFNHPNTWNYKTAAAFAQDQVGLNGDFSADIPLEILVRQLTTASDFWQGFKNASLLIDGRGGGYLFQQPLARAQKKGLFTTIYGADYVVGVPSKPQKAGVHILSGSTAIKSQLVNIPLGFPDNPPFTESMILGVTPNQGGVMVTNFADITHTVTISPTGTIITIGPGMSFQQPTTTTIEFIAANSQRAYIRPVSPDLSCPKPDYNAAQVDVEAKVITLPITNSCGNQVTIDLTTLGFMDIGGSELGPRDIHLARGGQVSLPPHGAQIVTIPAMNTATAYASLYEQLKVPVIFSVDGIVVPGGELAVPGKILEYFFPIITK